MGGLCRQTTNHKKRVRRIDEPYKLCYFMSFKKQLNLPHISEWNNIRNGHFQWKFNRSLSFFILKFNKLFHPVTSRKSIIGFVSFTVLRFIKFENKKKKYAKRFIVVDCNKVSVIIFESIWMNEWNRFLLSEYLVLHIGCNPL